MASYCHGNRLDAPDADVRTMEPPFLFFIIAFAAPFRMLKDDQVLACNAVLNCSGHTCLGSHTRFEDNTCKQHLHCAHDDHSSPCKRDQVEQHTGTVSVTRGQHTTGFRDVDGSSCAKLL